MRRALAVLAAVTVLAGLATGLALAERHQEGNLVVGFQGRVAPLKLPRHRPVPVSIHLAGTLRTTDGSALPRIAAMEFDLAGGGGLDTRGLPACRLRRIRHTRDREALAACGPALVGHGRIDAQAVIPGQPPLIVHTHILVFNGRGRGGATTLLLHAYATRPPISIVIPFALRHGRGRFGTVLFAPLPRRELGPQPSIARFSMTLSRRFSYRGSRRSFLAASCPAPPRFTLGIFSLAQLELRLGGGGSIATEIVRTCRVR